MVTFIIPNTSIYLDWNASHVTQMKVAESAIRKQNRIAQNKTTEEKHAVCSNCHNTKANCGSCHANVVKEGFNHKMPPVLTIQNFIPNSCATDATLRRENSPDLTANALIAMGNGLKKTSSIKWVGSLLDETHSAMECTDCHQEKNFAKPTCANCHDDKSYPKNVPGKLKRINESVKILFRRSA